MYIETKRMIIRDLSLEDMNDLHEILGDAETMENCEPAWKLERPLFIWNFAWRKRRNACLAGAGIGDVKDDTDRNT